MKIVKTTLYKSFKSFTVLSFFFVLCCFTEIGIQTALSQSLHVLDNTPDDGSVKDGTVKVEVDGFGQFGTAGAGGLGALYTPEGDIEAAQVAFQSFVVIGFGDNRITFTRESVDGPGITGDKLSASSSFDISNAGTPDIGSSLKDVSLHVILNQQLVPLFESQIQVGSALIQEYTISNVDASQSTVDFDLIRYFDGDLNFDGNRIDGGGRLLTEGGVEILFETDSATGASEEATFVGISTEGGTVPETNRFEIDEFFGLGNRIINGETLDDNIFGDTNNDKFIDQGKGYDVTLALRNEFSIPFGSTIVYTTRTIFGTGVPEEFPGVVDITPVSPETGRLGETLDIAINGNNFQEDAESNFGQGVTVNRTDFISSTQLMANITISEDAVPGFRTVTVTNPDGQSGSLPDAFRVLGLGPTVKSVDPDQGKQDESLLDVRINGTNLQDVVIVEFGDGIDVGTPEFLESTQQLSVDIFISEDAVPGFRTVTVTNDVVTIDVDAPEFLESTQQLSVNKFISEDSVPDFRTVTVPNSDGQSGSLPDAFEVKRRQPPSDEVSLIIIPTTLRRSIAPVEVSVFIISLSNDVDVEGIDIFAIPSAGSGVVLPEVNESPVTTNAVGAVGPFGVARFQVRFPIDSSADATITFSVDPPSSKTSPVTKNLAIRAR